MKTIYWEYYHPNKAEFKKMKGEAVFIFDASSLLGIYSLPEVKMLSLFGILKQFSENKRVWIPHQFGEEYQRHRKDKIKEQFNYYDKTVENLDKFCSEIKARIIPDFKEHYSIRKQEIHKKFLALTETIKKELEELKEGQPDWRRKDPVCDILEQVFKDNSGCAYKDDEHATKIEEVEKRIKQRKQPGLSDSKGLNRDTINGDALGWLQILDYVQSTKKPTILITEETKPDFWEEKKVSDKIFPRRALIREMYDKTGQLFFILNLEEFFKFTQEKDYMPAHPDALEKDETITSVNVIGSENTDNIINKTE